MLLRHCGCKKQREGEKEACCNNTCELELKSRLTWVQGSLRDLNFCLSRLLLVLQVRPWQRSAASLGIPMAPITSVTTPAWGTVPHSCMAGLWCLQFDGQELMQQSCGHILTSVTYWATCLQGWTCSKLKGRNLLPLFYNIYGAPARVQKWCFCPTWRPVQKTDNKKPGQMQKGVLFARKGRTL